MPFEETHVVDERTRFIEDVHRSLKSFTAICERYGISRTTGYKWLARWKAHGPPGLEDRPSRPKHCPWATTPEVVEAILDLRRTYDDYGAKKIRWFLQRHRPELDLPSRTTIHNILCRHDLVPKRRRRVRRWHPGRPDTSADTSNESWSADFKGEFPIISFQDGVSEATGAMVLSVYLAGQAVGTIVGGVLTDRMDRTYLLAGLTSLALPAHLFAFWLPAGSPLMLLFAAAAGCLNLALMPLIVVLAQEILPESKGVSSGIVMGLAWAASSIAVIGFGFLADAIGPRPGAIVSLPLLVIGTILAFHPTLRLHRRPEHS